MFRRSFELTDGRGEVVAGLHWTNLFMDRVVAQCAEGLWEFRRAGLFSRRVVIQREGSDVEVGTFTRGFFGGRLELASGREYRIRLLKFWPRRWGVFGGSDRPLIRVEVAFPLFKDRARVTIAPEAAENQDIPLLVLIAWFQILHVRHRGSSS
jgi:hypothetical protein